MYIALARMAEYEEVTVICSKSLNSGDFVVCGNTPPARITDCGGYVSDDAASMLIRSGVPLVTTVFREYWTQAELEGANE